MKLFAMLGLASLAGWASRRSDGIVPAKSIQKPREQKNSFEYFFSNLAFVASVFHVSDFLPLLRRVIRKSGIRALRQFLLTNHKYKLVYLINNDVYRTSNAKLRVLKKYENSS